LSSFELLFLCSEQSQKASFSRAELLDPPDPRVHKLPLAMAMADHLQLK
jgi:hypothetical protein